MCSSREQLSVLRVSTMPSNGLSARFAIPVLNDMLVMSRMAVPVVSDPVPAVVGTFCRCVYYPPATSEEALTCNERSKSLRDRFALADRSVDEVEEVRVLVDCEPVDV
jgi:hypothetical protein